MRITPGSLLAGIAIAVGIKKGDDYFKDAVHGKRRTKILLRITLGVVLLAWLATALQNVSKYF